MGRWSVLLLVGKGFGLKLAGFGRLSAWFGLRFLGWKRELDQQRELR